MFDPLKQQSNQIDSKAADQFDQIGKFDLSFVIMITCDFSTK